MKNFLLFIILTLSTPLMFAMEESIAPLKVKSCAAQLTDPLDTKTTTTYQFNRYKRGSLKAAREKETIRERQQQTIFGKPIAQSQSDDLMEQELRYNNNGNKNK